MTSRRATSMLLRCLSLGLAVFGLHRVSRMMNAVHGDDRRTLVELTEPIVETVNVNTQEFHENSTIAMEMPPIVLPRKNNSSIPTASCNSAAEFPQRLRRRRRRKKSNETLQVRTLAQDGPIPLKVPTPIFVPSLPKSGTTSIHNYFRCGGHKSAHHVYRIDGKVENKIGRCVQRNLARAKTTDDPFGGCGDYDIWTDTGFVSESYHNKVNNHQGDTTTTNNTRTPPVSCYYPLVESLEEIFHAYPNATILFVVRDENAWLNSIEKYHEGFIMDVWRKCPSPYFPAANATREDFRSFYVWHRDLIREFAKQHPSLTYIEVPLEADGAGAVLEEHIGIPQICWGQWNKLRAGHPMHRATC